MKIYNKFVYLNLLKNSHYSNMKSKRTKTKGPSKAFLQKFVEQRKHEEEERKALEEAIRKEEEQASLLEEKLRKEAEEKRKCRREQKRKKREKQRQVAQAKIWQDKREKLLSLTTTSKHVQKVKEECEILDDTPGPPDLRAPILVFLGHVDAGKTKLLDKIREHTLYRPQQTREAGGITQNISGTYLSRQCLEKNICGLSIEIDIPGILMIDTPGHKIFDHLRNRGSDICDLAVLVIDITQGIQLQTDECLHFLLDKNVPFIIALTKLDALIMWETCGPVPFSRALEKQDRVTKVDFKDKVKDLKYKLMEYGFNADLHTSKGLLKQGKVPIIPISSITGEGISDLLGWTTLFCQKSSLRKKIKWKDKLRATVLEVQKIKGSGAVMDVILVDGCLRIGDEIRVCGLEGIIETKIRSLWIPNAVDTIYGSNTVRVIASGVENVVCGSPIEYTTLEKSADSAVELFHQSIQRLFITDKEGVSVHAPTVGALEALVKLLRTQNASVCNMGIGEVHLKDIKKVGEGGTILAFDVKIDPKAQNLAHECSIRIFSANIIYHLINGYMNYLDREKAKLKKKLKKEATFPCKLQILSEHVYHNKSPFIFGVRILKGVLFPGTILAIPQKQMVVGTVTSIQKMRKEVDLAQMNEEVSIQIECSKNYIYGRHFDSNDLLLSYITRKSLNLLKEHFREEIRTYRHCNVIELLKELKSVYKI